MTSEEILASVLDPLANTISGYLKRKNAEEWAREQANRQKEMELAMLDARLRGEMAMQDARLAEQRKMDRYRLNKQKEIELERQKAYDDRADKRNENYIRSLDEQALNSELRTYQAKLGGAMPKRLPNEDKRDYLGRVIDAAKAMDESIAKDAAQQIISLQTTVEDIDKAIENISSDRARAEQLADLSVDREFMKYLTESNPAALEKINKLLGKGKRFRDAVKELGYEKDYNDLRTRLIELSVGQLTDIQRKQLDQLNRRREQAVSEIKFWSSKPGAIEAARKMRPAGTGGGGNGEGAGGAGTTGGTTTTGTTGKPTSLAGWNPGGGGSGGTAPTPAVTAPSATTPTVTPTPTVPAPSGNPPVQDAAKPATSEPDVTLRFGPVTEESIPDPDRLTPALSALGNAAQWMWDSASGLPSAALNAADVTGRGLGLALVDPKAAAEQGAALGMFHPAMPARQYVPVPAGRQVAVIPSGDVPVVPTRGLADIPVPSQAPSMRAGGPPMPRGAVSIPVPRVFRPGTTTVPSVQGPPSPTAEQLVMLRLDAGRPVSRWPTWAEIRDWLAMQVPRMPTFPSGNPLATQPRSGPAVVPVPEPTPEEVFRLGGFTR